MGDAGAVADDVQAIVAALELAVYFHFHVVELDLDAVEQGIVVGGAGGHLVQGIDHLDDAVQDALGQHQAQIAGGGIEGRCHKGLGDTAGCRQSDH